MLALVAGELELGLDLVERSFEELVRLRHLLDLEIERVQMLPQRRLLGSAFAGLGGFPLRGLRAVALDPGEERFLALAQRGGDRRDLPLVIEDFLEQIFVSDPRFTNLVVLDLDDAAFDRGDQRHADSPQGDDQHDAGRGKLQPPRQRHEMDPPVRTQDELAFAEQLAENPFYPGDTD